MRGPCCEKMGQKKGPWTPEEDQILISYIQTFGHDNWRALPKQAGLLRCGKSCRLRWTNYLRPGIKRGNFSKEEEENIIKLHQILGNRWSAIATRLPGRTDNEIKNFWHTHLKKKLARKLPNMETSTNTFGKSNPFANFSSTPLLLQNLVPAPVSAQNLIKDSSSSTPDSPLVKTTRPHDNEEVTINASPNVQEMHQKNVTKNSFTMPSKFLGVLDSRHWFSSFTDSAMSLEEDGNAKNNGDMAFWYNLFIKAGDQSQDNVEK